MSIVLAGVALALQLTGALLILWGAVIVADRRGKITKWRSGVVAALRSSWRRVTRRAPSSVGAVHASIGPASLRATGHVRQPWTDALVDTKVEWLREDLSRLTDQVNENRRSAEQRIDQLTGRVDHQQAWIEARVRDDDELLNKVLPLELAGATLAALGTGLVAWATLSSM